LFSNLFFFNAQNAGKAVILTWILHDYSVFFFLHWINLFESLNSLFYKCSFKDDNDLNAGGGARTAQPTKAGADRENEPIPLGMPSSGVGSETTRLFDN
jgi:hypothetical protein